MTLDRPTDESGPWSIQKGRSLIKDARREHLIAQRLIDFDRASSEDHSRRSLAIARRALHWLEDGPLEDEAHALLHEYGLWTRERFRDGCVFGWNGDHYEHICPVTLGHQRWGFSIGFTGDRICSICGQDLSECDHFVGRWYEVTGGPNARGHCRVCAKQECTEHLPSKIYRASCMSIVTVGEIHEVSIVGRPAQPDARPNVCQVPDDVVFENMGTDFEFGQTLHCNFCQQSCSGFAEIEGAAHAAEYIPKNERKW
jgi:hypothetical protein